MKLSSAICLSTVLVALSSPAAHATLLAYDGFDYAPGTLAGNGSALDLGFSTSWTESGTNGGGNVVPGSLSYSNLTVSGGALDLSGVGTTLNFRGLDASYSEPASTSTGEIWFSYLMQPGDFTGTPFVGLSFYTDEVVGTSAADPDFGLVARNQSGLKYGFGDLDVTSNHIESNVAVPTNGETVLLVGRVIFGGGSNTTANNEDRIHIYVNPAIGGAVPLSDADANVTANFQSMRFAAQNGAPFMIDEFRLGESFADVTPTTVPEPTSVAMLALLMVLGKSLAITNRCRD